MTQLLLLIAKNWPEPNSTAAGRRTLDLLSLFSAANYDIHIASAAEKTPFQADLDEKQITTHKISVNDSNFDSWLEKLSPQIVIFDRYVMEEQFGWRVRMITPDAMTILDTSDLHCLREARQTAFKTGNAIDLYNPTALRELTSISRCDLCLVISKFESELLEQKFQLSKRQILYLPFIVEENDFSFGLPFEERMHCIMFGGFKHEPNRDATHWLKESLWPTIRQLLPENVEMHVFGAYADHAINQLNAPKERFFIKGRAADALKTMENYRINLAPLRFGAGQKGKVLEGWLTGTPTITTQIGAEGMAANDDLQNSVAYTDSNLANLVATAYSDSNRWHQLQTQGHVVLRKSFLRSQYEQPFLDIITKTKSKLSEHRHANFWGRLLWQNQFRASEFMSRWIELKNKDQ